MWKKLFSVMMSLVVAAMMTTAAFAEFVYVTKNGKKYHHANSRFIKNKDAEKITVEEAEERGLQPSKDFLKFKASLQKAQEEKE